MDSNKRRDTEAEQAAAAPIGRSHSPIASRSPAAASVRSVALRVWERVIAAWRTRSDIALVRASGMFDESWYLARYPDVARGRLSALEHFVRFGGREGRLPSPRFMSSAYLRRYPDVAAARLNPLVHYLRSGRAEGRRASHLRHDAPGALLLNAAFASERGTEPDRIERMAAAAFAEPGFIGHDADWQFPAITEKHAFEMARRHLPVLPNTTYFAFPWATLIDQIKSDSPRADELIETAGRIAREAAGAARVVTVCQHIHFSHVAGLMADLGVTDVFWSHARKGERSLAALGRRLQLHPFPLYPVQATSAAWDESAQRPHLFSFIGARPNEWYLTDSRNWILDDLASDGRGVVTGREGWHYQKVVYDHQIYGFAGQSEGLVDEDASRQFRKILGDSVFSLCPSGSGPNSIRLWESIGAGAIPVVLSDLWAPPGDPALWEDAAVFLPETRDAVRALPDQLEAMSRDAALMARKRNAMRQLWSLYGPETFVSDIRALYLSLQSQDEAARGAARPPDTGAPA